MRSSVWDERALFSIVHGLDASDAQAVAWQFGGFFTDMGGGTKLIILAPAVPIPKFRQETCKSLHRRHNDPSGNLRH